MRLFSAQLAIHVVVCCPERRKSGARFGAWDLIRKGLGFREDCSGVHDLEAWRAVKMFLVFFGSKARR